MAPSPFESRVVGIIPSAWGTEAAEAVLAALQSVCLDQCTFDVLVVGDQSQDEIRSVVARGGAVTVYELQGEQGLADSPDAIAHVIEHAFANAELDTKDLLLLTPPGPEGEELAAGVALRLKGQALGRCQKVELTETGVIAERSVWGGRKRALIEVGSGLAIACLRAGKPELASEAAAVARQTIQLDAEPFPGVALDIEETGESMLPVESCKLVVSGGRGVGEEGFGLLEQIARKVEGSLGGSLPAVDAGMVPVVRQVGISGKFVSPELYFAVGISGTPQHMAGISTEARILAVNKDPEAPIFSVAEAGVVGEWQQLLPEILKALDA